MAGVDRPDQVSSDAMPSPRTLTGGADVGPLSFSPSSHSTRPRDFIRLPRRTASRVIDVRTLPGLDTTPSSSRPTACSPSRRCTTRTCGLGGLRRAGRDSSNMAWRTPLPRLCGYMQTPAFEENLNLCIALARRERVALMCAEAVPWRCHRSLIADALLVKGIDVNEITSGVRSRPHTLTAWARVTGKRVTYPAAGAQSGQSAVAAR